MTAYLLTSGSKTGEIIDLPKGMTYIDFVQIPPGAWDDFMQRGEELGMIATVPTATVRYRTRTTIIDGHLVRTIGEQFQSIESIRDAVDNAKGLDVLTCTERYWL